MANVINWFDIPTLDFDRAVKFYSTILGAEIKLVPMGNSTVGLFPMDGEGVGGNLNQPGEDLPSVDGTCVYLNVDGRIDEVLEQVEIAGGKILNPKDSLPDVGWIAHIIDTEGNKVGLHSKI